uniref:ATP-dependent DNA helicase n=1 Tax=Brassica oleracea TaxID=3712 RepID=A0A3P6DRS3_BRAOL|nr:unnamed protein product [Brassica oleracea]
MQRRLRLIQKRKFGDRNIQEVNQTGISMIQSQNVHKLPSQGSRIETQNQNISVMENHPIETQSNQTADLMASTVEQSGYPSKKRACREKSSSLIRKQESVKGNTKFSNRHGGHTIRMSPSVQNITQSTLSDIGVLINPTQTLCSEGPHSSGTTNLTDIPGPSSSAISVESDSSDNDDDLWDCSSGEGVETGTDSDTCDDNSSEILKRQAQTKFELVSKAEKALAEMFGRLQNKKTKVADSAPIVSTQEKGDRGTKNMVVDRTRFYVFYEYGFAKNKAKLNNLLYLDFADMSTRLQKKKTAVTVCAPIVSTKEKGDKDYKDDGDLTNKCPKCGALFWYNERGLLTNDDPISKHYQDNIRALNMMFSFTSLGGKIDNSVNMGKGPKVFKLHGENFHLIGSVKPKPTEPAKFSQLYIHDTENEVRNRISALSGNSERSKIREDLVEAIMNMLRVSNVHVKTFRNAKDRFNNEDEREELSLVLIHSRLKDGRVYNLPTSSEVAALVVGDFQENMDKRDIILEKNSGKLKRINELHPCYLPLQKPNISMREFFAYRIMVREVGSQVLLLSRRLLQQFLVDAYTMIESHRLRYIRKNQSNLRTLKFSKFVAAANDGNSSVAIEGNRIIIPSSFTGGPRYMHQMYLDAMSICKYFGFPDLFITFTCNPKWPELTRYFKKYNLKSEDRPDLCCRLFKIKLDSMMDDLTKKQLLGKTVSGLILSEEEVLNETLVLIEKILRSKNSSLSKWETMPKPVFIDHSVYDNNLLQEELNYARKELRGQHDQWITQLTDEQRSVYDAILGSVMSGKGGVFFVYGFGGTGKTFLWNILSAAIRSKGDVVLNVASSGIASLLLPGGRTAHSRFGEERTYLSSDSIDPADLKSKDDSVFSPEFLNSIKTSGLPNHALRLRIGTPVMLIRNLDPTEGQCNGTRLQITGLAKHILQAKIITGTRVGETVFLHRVLIEPSDSKLPFKMRRRQFPLKVAFAMTINKSQGQTLSNVGLFLPRPVFSHGQLYVAVSRVKSRKGLKILITDKDQKPQESTLNVVFKEVFQNLFENCNAE